MKKNIAWAKILNRILVAFFLLGAFMNLLGPISIAQEFVKWGYPAWFRYVTGTLEISVAGLLWTRRSRIFGIVLGGLVMLSALLTLLFHAERIHAAIPAIVLLALYMALKMGRLRR